jgi:hypothetical protein
MLSHSITHSHRPEIHSIKLVKTQKINPMLIFDILLDVKKKNNSMIINEMFPLYRIGAFAHRPISFISKFIMI